MIKESDNNTCDILEEHLLGQRKIFLFGDIDDEISEKVVKQLHYLVATNLDPISIYINSSGGSVDSALSIIDTINLIKHSVIIKTICYQAGSCASYILAFGSEGYRYAFPNSSVMMHNVTLELPENEKNKQESFMKFTKEHVNNLESQVAKACKKKLKEFSEAIQNDLYMNAKQAKTYKIIDKIITRLDEI